MHDLNGTLFLKVSLFLFLTLLSPSTVIVPFTIIHSWYVGLYPHNSRCPHLLLDLSRKQKYWITYVTNLYIIFTLKVSSFWKNVYKSGEMQNYFLINFMKRCCQLEKGIWNCYIRNCNLHHSYLHNNGNSHVHNAL